MVDLHSANYEMDPGVTRGINLLAARAERSRLKIQPPSCEKGIARECVSVASGVRVRVQVAYMRALVSVGFSI